MKTVAIITPGDLPIPAVMGGAIETLVTYLIDENEKYGEYEFHIYNTDKYQDKYSNLSYKHTYIHTVKCTSKLDKYINRAFQLVCKITGHRIPFKSIYINKVCSELAKQNYDDVLIEGLPYFAWSIKTQTGISPILHIHTDIFDDKTRNAKQVLASCKRILCVSEYISEKVKTIPNSATADIKVYLNCADINQFSIENRSKYRSETRKKLGINENDKVFIYAGRLNPLKGVKEIVEAFKQIAIENKRLILAGGSNFGDSKVDSFVEYLKSESINDPRIILTGFVPHTELHKTFAAANFYVAPSMYYEAAPLTNIEANSMGIRSIISDRGGSKEYSYAGFSIIISVDVNPVKNILDAMNSLLNQERDVLSAVDIEKYSVDNYYNNLKQYL